MPRRKYLNMLIPLIVSLGGGFPSDFMLFLIVFNIFQNVNSKHVFFFFIFKVYITVSEHMKQDRGREGERAKGTCTFYVEMFIKGTLG